MSIPAANSFRFYLKADVDTYYYVDSDGLVQTIVSPADYSIYSLQDDPFNWGEIEIKWGRSPTYYGLFRGVTSAMEFVGDAALICRKIYFTQGVEGVCLFVIEQCDGLTSEFEPLYEGSVDFATCSIDLTKVTASIAEGGLQSLIEAKENTPFDIPVVSGTTTVQIEGPELQANHSWLPLGLTLSNPALKGYILPSVFIGQDGEYDIGVPQSPGVTDAIYDPFGSTIPTANFPNFIFRATTSISGVFYGAISLTFTNNSGNVNPRTFEAQLLHVDADRNKIGAPYTLYTHPSSTAVGATTSILFAFSQAITMSAGDRIYLILSVQGEPVTYVITPNPTGSFPWHFELASTFQMPTTTTKGYRYYEVLDKLTASITNSVYTASSPFLYDPSGLITSVDSKPYQVIVTPAASLKGAANPSLTVKLTDLFKDAHGRWMLGLGINSSQQLLIDHLSAFFDAGTEILDLGEVTNLRIMPAKEYMFTQFKTGYDVQTYDNLNGSDEFNTTSTYKMPLNAPEAREQDFTSNWRADVFGIESVRNSAIEKTTDSNSDKSIFLLDIEATPTSGVYALRRPNTALNTGGVISPAKVYNISLSPARSAKRLGPLLHSVAYQRDSQDVTFQTAEKNQSLVSNIGSGSITENAHLPVVGLGSILFKPVVFLFDTVGALNLGALMASNPYGYISAASQGKTIEGFVLDASVRPGKSITKEWALLCSPNCDLDQFYPQ